MSFHLQKKAALLKRTFVLPVEGTISATAAESVGLGASLTVG
jgi:hypothetical protein